MNDSHPDTDWSEPDDPRDPLKTAEVRIGLGLCAAALILAIIYIINPF